GICRTKSSTPSAVDRSAPTPVTSPSPLTPRILTTASSTRSTVRPLMTTEAPSWYRPAAAANPIPAVEPVTNARLPRTCRSMSSSRLLVDRGGSRYDTSEWVMRPDPAIEFWEGETKPLHDGLTLIRCGGHFDGGTVMHWAA